MKTVKMLRVAALILVATACVAGEMNTENEVRESRGETERVIYTEWSDRPERIWDEETRAAYVLMVETGTERVVALCFAMDTGVLQLALVGDADDAREMQVELLFDSGPFALNNTGKGGTVIPPKVGGGPVGEDWVSQGLIDFGSIQAKGLWEQNKFLSELDAIEE